MQDKLHACKFLEDLMEGRNGHIVKQFICASPHCNKISREFLSVNNFVFENYYFLNLFSFGDSNRLPDNVQAQCPHRPLRDGISVTLYRNSSSKHSCSL
jgi:hypothetical protein